MPGVDFRRETHFQGHRVTWLLQNPAARLKVEGDELRLQHLPLLLMCRQAHHDQRHALIHLLQSIGNPSSMVRSINFIKYTEEKQFKNIFAGFKRELVYRSTFDKTKDAIQGDIYYFPPSGRKLRSSVEVAKYC
jgi:Methyl-CpG binding domain